MSGDVQPRRRKDKRRKKDDEDLGTPPPTLVSPSPDLAAENLTIHVHKEGGGTGGHWCARIIFFSLLAILVGLIGVILIEHRGAADVDTPVAESRWATVFDGLVDDVQVSHVAAEPEVKVDEPHEEPEESKEADGHSEEEEVQDDEQGIDSYNEEADTQSEERDQEEQSRELEDEVEESQERNDDDNSALEEVEEDEIINDVENELDSIEGVDLMEEKLAEKEEEEVDEDSTEFFNIPGVNEIDDNSAEPLEEIEEEEPEEIVNEAEIEPEIEEIEEESSSGVKAPRQTQSGSDDEPKPPTRKQGGPRDYEFDDITNPEDAVIREELDAAKGQTAEKRVIYFTELLSRRSKSPRAGYELARALDNLAEEKKDNSYLRRAVYRYQSVLDLGTLTPPELFRIVGERCIDRLRFIGQYQAAENVHKKLIQRFTDEPRLRNQLAVTYLMQNKLSEARKVLQETLGRWPDDGFALVHYGFILKIGDNNMIDAIMYLKAGIESGHEGTIDGRFFFHLGDALVRLGRPEEAKKVYQSGAEKGLFLSVYQRSLYNVDHLAARPWWTLEQTKYQKFFNDLEINWQIIKAEGLSVLGANGQFKNEAENLKDKGNWQQFELFARGHKIAQNCAKVPRTCSLVDGFGPAARCRRGQIKFSVMYPKTHVWPHCGPTNCRLRAHLGLSGTEGAYIRVGEETRTWSEGKVMVFDDSFEHEVWHNGTFTRLVLIVDVWHPELSESERRSLPAI